MKYLNFFEMVAHLTFQRAITDQDTETIFGYWLNQIQKFPPVQNGYLRENGCEQLDALLNGFKFE